MPGLGGYSGSKLILILSQELIIKDRVSNLAINSIVIMVTYTFLLFSNM